MRALLVLLTLAAGPVHLCLADRQSAVFAVVQIPSHGGSGVIVWTVQGRSYVVTSAHMFPGGSPGKARVVVLAPSPGVRWERRPASPRVIAYSARDDLVVLRLDVGPLPYVAPLPPADWQPSGRCLSVGYDEGRRPPQVREARIARDEGARILTNARPWHGRSGGALLDADTGYLVGICSGYEGGRGPRGPRGPRGSDPLFDSWEVNGRDRGIYPSWRAVARLLAPHLGGR